MTDFMIFTDILCFVTIGMIVAFSVVIFRHGRVLKKIVKQQEGGNTPVTMPHRTLMEYKVRCGICKKEWEESFYSDVTRLLCPHCNKEVPVDIVIAGDEGEEMDKLIGSQRLLNRMMSELDIESPEALMEYAPGAKTVRCYSCKHEWNTTIKTGRWELNCPNCDKKLVNIATVGKEQENRGERNVVDELIRPQTLLNKRMAEAIGECNKLEGSDKNKERKLWKCKVKCQRCGHKWDKVFFTKPPSVICPGCEKITKIDIIEELK